VLTRASGHCRGHACVAVLVAGVAALSSCSGPRSGISVRSNVDACAAALPVARVAVHRRGTLMGVHALHRGELRTLAKELGLPPPPSPSSSPVSSSPSTTPPSTTPPSTGPTTVSAPTTVLSGTSLPPEPEPHGCLVVFHGTYRAHAVDHPIGDPAGQYAIALVRLHKARLIVVIVADKLPESLEK
jgi:hypothetical protein